MLFRSVSPTVNCMVVGLTETPVTAASAALTVTWASALYALVSVVLPVPVASVGAGVFDSGGVVTVFVALPVTDTV